jgi:hypothetical protein
VSDQADRLKAELSAAAIAKAEAIVAHGVASTGLRKAEDDLDDAATAAKVAEQAYRSHLLEEREVAE